ncbi:prenyltransferase [Lactococcus nasutitermitis]|uniref:Prenyltransferase n=1 Tax=Lactococcus nasutitermitis TaxID=1652957 RepID=A0ABV9JE69_9LACT|nr:prenyltransferase [Lactococcus nasutitermitis]
MNFRLFAELIELKAKTASVFPFLLGLSYSLYHYHQANLVPLLLYFVAMFLFNCFVDIWDNYNDYHKAVDTEGYKKNTNIIGREEISLRTIRLLLAGFFFSSLILGLIVASMTGWVVFWLGLICYFVGIFYAAGPKPLSTLPVGEVASGITMGYLIFLICLYINAHTVLIWNIETILTTILVALPNTLLIANMMLANNTCDVEEDEANQRFTVVHYIGKTAALTWWKLAIILSFLFIVLAVILGILSPVMLGMIVIVPLIIKIARPYLVKQIKSETFVSSVSILMIFQFLQVVLMFIGLWLR